MSVPPPIRKAVLPVAGMGTRFLPATKAVPKEMLPVVDKPVVQYAVEEARAAGIEQFIFVSAEGKEAIPHHFSPAPHLEALLAVPHADGQQRLDRRPGTGAAGDVFQHGERDAHR